MAFYLSVAEIHQRLNALQTSAPALCTVTALPHQSEGSNPQSAPCLTIRKPGAGGRIKVLLVGGIHAREFAPPDALIELCEHLVSSGVGPAPAFKAKALTYGRFQKRASVLDAVSGERVFLDPTAAMPVEYPRAVVPRSVVQSVLDKLELLIVPCANPEGRAYALQPQSAAGPNFAMWRKNRRPIPGEPPCMGGLYGLDGSVGVDLNRNFDFAWSPEKHYDPTYLKINEPGSPVSIATIPCPPNGNSDAYNGADRAVPESEAEAKNIAELIRSSACRYFVDVHMFGPEIQRIWDTSENGTVNPQMNHLNTALDQRRKPGTYQEYIPRDLERATTALGDFMRRGIAKFATADPRGTSDKAYSSAYEDKTGFEAYPTTGGSTDYHSARQFSWNAATGVYSVVPPALYSYTIESGSLDQNGFHPDRNHEFPKISREIQLALWSLLAYAASGEKPKWPVKLAP
jgi:hypothetical protein